MFLGAPQVSVGDADFSEEVVIECKFEVVAVEDSCGRDEECEDVDSTSLEVEEIESTAEVAEDEGGISVEVDEAESTEEVAEPDVVPVLNEDDRGNGELLHFPNSF
jgi:hypothetical protein